MQQITAAGGVVYRRKEDRLEVLLIYRRDVWDLPKGKKEEGETIKESARREVAEEVGIPLPDVEGFLIRTYHEYRIDGQNVGKTTHWYQMTADTKDNFVPQREEGIEKVQWVELAEAARMVGYDNLKEVLGAFEQTVK